MIYKLLELNSKSPQELLEKKDEEYMKDMLDEELRKLSLGLEKFPNVFILSDEIYSRILFDNNQHATLLSYPEIFDYKNNRYVLS